MKFAENMHSGNERKHCFLTKNEEEFSVYFPLINRIVLNQPADRAYRIEVSTGNITMIKPSTNTGFHAGKVYSFDGQSGDKFCISKEDHILEFQLSETERWEFLNLRDLSGDLG